MKKKWFEAKYLGGHSEYQKTDGWIHLTNNSFSFESAKWRLDIPYEKIREINVKTIKEITVLRALLLTPFLASWFTKKREFLLVGYEDKFRLRQNLFFDTKHKREIIHNVRSSLAKLRARMLSDDPVQHLLRRIEVLEKQAQKQK